MNIFKSVLDGGVYILLYLIIPIMECFLVLSKTLSYDFFWLIISLSACFLYDCYTRFSGTREKKKKLVIVGACAFWILVCGIVFLRISSKISLSIYFIFFFIPVFIPFAIAMRDLIKRINKLISA